MAMLNSPVKPAAFPMRYVKDHWPQLLLTLVTAGFALGTAWAMQGDRLGSAERRISDVESAHVAETRWQVQQNTAVIGSIQSDVRRTDADISQINARLGGIDAKLDAIAESLKRRP